MDAAVGENADTVAELPPEVVETGLTCLEMLARFHNVAVSAEQLSHEHVSRGCRFWPNASLSSKPKRLRQHFSACIL